MWSIHYRRPLIGRAIAVRTFKLTSITREQRSPTIVEPLRYTCVHSVDYFYLSKLQRVAAKGCSAYAQNRQYELPVPRPKKKLPTKPSRFLFLLDESGSILLQKRPPAGIWGGLWSVPEADLETDLESLCLERWGLKIKTVNVDNPVRHSFSHYHLDITPCYITVDTTAAGLREAGSENWYQPSEIQDLALSAPVSRLLKDRLNNLTSGDRVD